MNLFNPSDIMPMELPKSNPIIGLANLAMDFKQDKNLENLNGYLANLNENQSIYFMTDGAWSNIDIIEALLLICGPASLSFCTWSISIDAIRKFTEWQASGAIQNLQVIMDQGIRNRKPEIYQQSTVAFKNLRLIKCHAKVAVITNEQYSFVVMGSANLTNNPRKEAGLIVRSQEIATANLQWIGKEFADA